MNWRLNLFMKRHPEMARADLIARGLDVYAPAVARNTILSNAMVRYVSQCLLQSSFHLSLTTLMR